MPTKPQRPWEINDVAETPTRKVISDIPMSCQFVTNPQNKSQSNSRFFQNSNCNLLWLIPTWDTLIDTIPVNYVFGSNISKQIPIVWYFGSTMSGLDNQYLRTAYIWQVNPIIYTDPGNILFSWAFVNDIELGINYEIWVNFTNFGMFNHNFDIKLSFIQPEDIEWHIEIMRNDTWENIWTELTDIDYKQVQAIRIIVKTPEQYLQEIEWSLYIGTQEYGNDTEIFWIQTKADPTPPTISRVKNIAKWWVRDDIDNIWQIRANWKNEIKIWYDYVDSPSNCNSGIIMNEYHNLSEINIKNHASGAESLNNKYVCIYVKDLVSSVVTTWISNQIKLTSVWFTDDIMPGPVYYDSVQVKFDNAYNYKYTWTPTKWRCNANWTNEAKWNKYDWLFILNSTEFNNKYMCVKAEDSKWNTKYFTSENSVNIVGRDDVVYFVDWVNPSWNNEDIIEIWFDPQIEFTTKAYKRVSNILECSNTGWMAPYDWKIIIDNQYFNWYYFCLYTLESGSNIENYLISPNPVKVDNISPTNPTIVSPKDNDTISYLVIQVTWAHDSDAGIVWYEYQIATDSLFMDNLDEWFIVSSWNIIMPKFDKDEWWYFIRIRAIDGAGNVSDSWNQQQIIWFEYKWLSGLVFDSITWADLSRNYSSNTITVQWIEDSGTIYVEVTNWTLYRNWIGQWSGAEVKSGDVLSIRMKSSDKYNKTVSSSLIMLSKIISWDITTKEQDPILWQYNIDDEWQKEVQDIFDKMMVMYSDEWERMEMFYTMKSMLKDEIALNPNDSWKLKYMLYLIDNYLDDDWENWWKIHTAPNCKKYEITYNADKEWYYSPDMKVSNWKISYFATITDLLRYIDSRNTEWWDCGYHIYKKVGIRNNNKEWRHIAPSGKIYDTIFTNIWYTSTDLVTTKYFASLYELKSYINSNNPSVSLLSWDHTVDDEFTPEDYTAPNWKVYKIYNTDKWYMSYKFLSVKYFETLDSMKSYININNPK